MHPLRRVAAAVVGSALTLGTFGVALIGAGSALGATTTSSTSTSTPSTQVSAVDWPSGVFNSRSVSTTGVTSFGTFRGRTVDVAVLYASRDSWSDFSTNLWGVKQFAGFPGTLSVAIPLTIGSATLSQVAAGNYDKYFTTWAKNLAATGRGASDIRIGWEFNGNWMPWSAYNAANFLAAFRHVSTLVKGLLPKSQIDWNGNWGNSQCGNDALTTLYPGNAYVDVVGVDAYDGGWVPANSDAAFAGWLTGKNGLQDWYNFAVAHGKKFSVPEWGLVPTDEGDNPAFVRGMYNFFAVNAAHLAFESYFNGATNALRPALMPKASAEYQQLWSQLVTPSTAPMPLTLVPGVSADPWGSAHAFSTGGLPGTATGTVTYSVAGTTICPASVVNGTATCTGASSLSPGAYTVTAAYSGDTHYAAGSASAAFTVLLKTPVMLPVNAAPSTLAGQSANLAVYHMPGTAKGPVTFTSGGVTLCQGQLVGGKAHCASPTSLAAGTHAVSASWPGDTLFTRAATTLQLTVTPVQAQVTPAAITLRPAVSSDVWGAAHSFSTAGLPATATGTVTYTVNGTTACSATVAAGTAACKGAGALNPGSYTVTAAYTGDRGFAPATATAAFTVLRKPAKMVATVATPTTPAGRPVDLGVYRLPGEASAVVSFRTGGTTLCQAKPVGGVAHCGSPTSLAAGKYTVTASWGGDALFLPVSTTLQLTVTAAA